MEIRILDSLTGLRAAEWDDLVGPHGCPFLEHGFLLGLEVSGCLGPDSGWHPRYVTAWSRQRLVGAAPAYLKMNSYGEFIFDWSWADAAHRAGMPYYPKIVVAAPFSPVTGPRFLVAPGEPVNEVRRLLLVGLNQVATVEGVSGLHILFCTEEEASFLAQEGLAIRHTHQFHWQNDGYGDFEDFLARFRSKRRNQIRRERRRVIEAGARVEMITGSEVDTDAIDDIWRYYTDTVDKFMWGRRYLNRAFFDYLGTHFNHRLCLLFAKVEGRRVAGTFNVVKDGVFYGRYWGAERTIPNLHFELCSYAPVELGISEGWRRVEAGAGGRHKLGRGYLPAITRSAHQIFLPGLKEAVIRFLEYERADIAEQFSALEGSILKCSADEFGEAEARPTSSEADEDMS